MYDSVPSLAFEKAKSNDCIISSLNTIYELSKTILKKKFDRYVSVETRIEFLEEFLSFIDLIPVKHRIEICRDPKDNMYLELASSGNADIIVTGDNDLLILDPFSAIRIITPKEFMEHF